MKIPKYALSIKQPWAWLICKGYKDVENRSWSTKFRGRIYVHAGKKVDNDGAVWLWQNMDMLGIKGCMPQWTEICNTWRDGAIIGEVDITDCKFRSGEGNDNLYSVWHAPGQYSFVLANPVLYDKPIPCKGKLGFFEPDV